MKIFLEGTGPLKEYMGKETLEIEVGADSTVADLYPVIDEHWGSVLPPHIWNSKKHNFRGAVIVVINGTPVRDINLKLNQGDQIQLVKVLTGG